MLRLTVTPVIRPATPDAAIVAVALVLLGILIEGVALNGAEAVVPLSSTPLPLLSRNVVHPANPLSPLSSTPLPLVSL